MSSSNSNDLKRCFAGFDFEIPQYSESSADDNNASDDLYDSDSSFDSDHSDGDYYEEGWQEKEQEKADQEEQEDIEDGVISPSQIPDFNMLKRRGMRKPEV